MVECYSILSPGYYWSTLPVAGIDREACSLHSAITAAADRGAISIRMRVEERSLLYAATLRFAPTVYRELGCLSRGANGVLGMLAVVSPI